MSNRAPAPSVRNITRVFRTATPAQIAAGTDWYRDAHLVAKAYATAHGVSVPVAAGVIAALSPLNSWGANVNLAARFLATEGGLTSGYLTLGLDKARAIVAGADIPTTLRGEKITAFYYAIVSDGRTDEVVVDRHAIALAINLRQSDADRMTVKGKRYQEFVDCYRRAARILSKEMGQEFTPSEVQAITWVTWRSRFWSEGAFDPKA